MIRITVSINGCPLCETLLAIETEGEETNNESDHSLFTASIITINLIKSNNFTKYVRLYFHHKTFWSIHLIFINTSST